MADNLFNGQRFLELNVVDNFSPECLVIHAGKSLKGEDVVSVMKARRMLDKRLPVRIQADNGSEFISKSLDTVSRWTSPALENRQIIRLLNHLTVTCATNA